MFDNREFMNSSILVGERVQLKQIEKVDGKRLEHILSTLQTIDCATFDMDHSYFGSKRMLNQILSRELENFIHFGIWLRKANELIGLISFQHWSRVQAKATIGYMLDRTYWNQGLATEALRLLLEFGFTELGLLQVEGRCYKNNIASEKVMTKNGLLWIRTLPARYGARNLSNEIHVYGLSEASYRQS
ncbi:GNAT family N-acetyltransferase [Paenibacillus glacialis]|uniref:N-acetyltransferase domain-containing protein n=1 Tax=Paenibacillus glacialis TaxID=494026 RepID=A0A168NLG5_9BACL|nr:GNAT family N-acetyltransferase [Paenibacillus glacialis]OAB45908.1 hypothetical protein PGLA_00480 [Paenibacillus glacialis]